MPTILSPLTNFACLEIKGGTVKEFLQGQLTCDIDKIDANSFALCGYCNEKGRIVASGYITKYKQSFYLIISRQLIAYTKQKFKQYAVFSNVTITHKDDIALLGCIGRPGNISFPINNYEATTTNKANIACINYEHEIYIIMATKNDLIPLQDTLSSQPNTELVIDLFHWEQANINAGIAYAHPNTLEQLTPHMLNYHLLDAVSFTKGCFLGQEIIARTQHRGRYKRKLYKAVVSNTSDVKIGSTITTKSGEIAGTTVAQSSPQKEFTNILLILADHTIKSKLFVNELPVENIELSFDPVSA